MEADDVGNIKHGTIGGRGGSATPGGYNRGTTIIVTGKQSGAQGLPNLSQKDLRGGNANAASGYNQGDEFAAVVGTSSKGIKAQHKDLRGGSSNPNTGYNQGNQK